MSRCTIELENMEFKAYHGCYDLEKKVGGHFVVNLSVDAEVGDAPARDDVSLTLNYLALYEVVREQMARPSDIIENVAERILAAVHESFGQVVATRVTVSKIAPPLGGKVGRVSVTMTK